MPCAPDCRPERSLELPRSGRWRSSTRSKNIAAVPYAGAVGYVDFTGNMDTCIALRTLVMLGDTAYIQAGAGIVADSVPATEYEETLNKAKGLLKAIELAERDLRGELIASTVNRVGNKTHEGTAQDEPAPRGEPFIAGSALARFV